MIIFLIVALALAILAAIIYVIRLLADSADMTEGD
jgi:hypothetical protein